MPTVDDPTHSFRYPQEQWERAVQLTALRGDNVTRVLADALDEYLDAHGHLLADAEAHTCNRCGRTAITGLHPDPNEPGEWRCAYRDSCTRRVRRQNASAPQQRKAS